MGTATINYRDSQGSILRPLMFLLYINDIPQALLSSHTYLYAEDVCIFDQHKDVKEVKNVLNKKTGSECEWFVDKNVSRFGEDKTKCFLYSREETYWNIKKFTMAIE